MVSEIRFDHIAEPKAGRWWCLEVFVRVVLVSAFVSILTGCASVLESLEYQRDTAISLGDYRYVINTQKCYEIRSISEDGVLQCYAEDGSQSAQVSPASEWQVTEFDKSFDFECLCKMLNSLTRFPLA